jgi:hypothetical protein
MTEENIDHKERPRGWGLYIGREIPMTFLIILALQTLGVAIWFGVVWAKIDNNAADVVALYATRYTKDDAAHDRNLTDARLQNVNYINGELARRLERLETMMDLMLADQTRESWRRERDPKAPSASGRIR